MKKFQELTEQQKERAVEESFRRVVKAITHGGLTFNDVANGDDLQARIEIAREEAGDDLYLFGVLISLRCAAEISTLAEMSARDAVYVQGDTVISIDDL